MNFLKLFIFLLLVTSCLFLVNFPVFAQGNNNASATPTGNLGLISCFGGFCPGNNGLNETYVGTTLEKIFSTLLGVFTVVAGLMLLIYFMLGSIGWLTAGGDQEKLKKAQQQLTNAILGLVMVVAAYSIIYLLGNVLGLDILNPSSMLVKLKP
jgi:hypothetical protein